MSDERVTAGHVAICLDRFATAYRVDLETEAVDIYFRAIEGLAAPAVLGCVDEYLMTHHWFPTPSQFREAALDTARQLALESQRRSASTSCGFCHGNLWGQVAPMEHAGVLYEQVEPCDQCAPLLYGRVLEINAARKGVERSTVRSETLFPFRVGDKVQECKDVLAEIEARLKAQGRRR